MNKKTISVILVLCVVLVILVIAPWQKEEKLMSVEFTNGAGQRVDFGTLPLTNSMQTKTVLMWVDIVTLAGGGDFGGMFPAVTGTDEFWSTYIGTAGSEDDRFVFFEDHVTTNGMWATTNVISTGLQMLAVSYDYGSTANNPVMYVNGVSVGVTETSTPSGAHPAGTNSSVRLGGVFGAFPSANTKILSYLVYNRILTAAEISNAYNSRLFIPSRNGLVFAPNLNGAAGGPADGDTMSASNTLRDLVSGTAGVPAGSPVFRANNVLTLGGE